MKKRLLDHIAHIDDYISKGVCEPEHEELISYHLQQILFIQHERFVHLIVVVLFALMALGCIFMTLFTPRLSLLFLFLAMFVLLVPYILHYYTLENGVQKMYDQYDELLRMSGHIIGRNASFVSSSPDE